jgi:hypothetical protein
MTLHTKTASAGSTSQNGSAQIADMSGDNKWCSNCGSTQSDSVPEKCGGTIVAIK